MGAWQSFRELFGPVRILWQNFSGYYGVGIDRFCPVSIVTSVDYGREYPAIERETGTRILAVERSASRRPKPSLLPTEDIALALSEDIADAISSFGPAPWAFVCPYPCETLPALAGELGHLSASLSPELCSWLNDKKNFLAGLEETGLPRLQGRWLSLSTRRYSELSNRIGPKLVAQRARGSSGSGTRFIRSEEEFQEAVTVLAGEAGWVTQETQGFSINMNAIVLDEAVVAGCPSVQLVGLEILGVRPGMYCGNDFTAAMAVDRVLLENIREQTERLGGWLLKLGYRGLFGLDFVVDADSGRACAVDLNPRWQGSTAICTQAETRAGRLPLAVADIAWKLGVLEEREILKRRDEFFQPLRASQLALQAGSEGWVKPEGELEPGVYATSPQAAYLRPGIRLDDLSAPEEALVTGAVLPRGCAIEPCRFLLRVYSERPAIDLATGEPLPWARRFTRALYDALRLSS